MALIDKLDQGTVDKLLKKVLIGSDKELISKKDVVNISNSITSLQNTFNAIYAHSLNIRNLHQYEEKRLQSIKRETNLENNTRPAAGQALNTNTSPGPDFTSTADLFNDLSVSIDKLNEKLKNVDLSGGSGLGEMAGGLAGEAVGAKSGASLGSKIAGPRGAVAGGLIGGVLGFFGGSSAASTLERRAVGGSVKTGGTYVVGERGPEVLTINGMGGRVTAAGQRGKTSQAEKHLLTSAEQSARARAQLEKGKPLGPTSYSTKFSNYLSSLFSNIPTWMDKIKGWLGITGDNEPYGGGILGEGQGYAAVGDLSGAEGDWKKDTDFINAINKVSQKYDIDANDLLGLIYHESAGTMSPTVKGNGSARGLFQFTSGGGFNSDEIVKMTRAQQVELADKRIFAASKLPRRANAGQIYAAVFLPGVAQNGGWTGVLSREGDKYYGQNPSLDTNGDKIIDYADLARVISDKRIALGLGASPSLRGYGTQSALGFLSPVGKAPPITDTFMTRGGKHKGIDIDGETGDLIQAVQSGTVVRAEFAGNAGNLVVIDHGNNMQTYYMHLSKISVAKDQRVSQGQEIGLMGSTGRSTGSHLHFEVRINGQPVDPGPYLAGAGAAARRSAPAAPKPEAPKRRLPAGYSEVAMQNSKKKMTELFIRTPSGLYIPATAKSAADVPMGFATASGRQEIENYFRAINK